MTGALGDLRVIDFGQYIAGPMAAMLLADQGADVIRVDPPGGPRFRTSGNATWNRGKRSIVLDLKHPGDADVARHLVDSADVVIENFRPGVMERLGLGPDAMLARNPALVYCSLPGFASYDPRAGLPGWEGIVTAAAGLYLTKTQIGIDDAGTGKYLARLDDTPIYTAIPVASSFAAFLGALGITMALLARDRDGRGQHVEVPLLNAVLAAAATPDRRVFDHGYPYSKQYECADGRWVDLHCTGERFVHRFFEAAGVTDWLGQDFVGDLSRPSWSRTGSFAVESPEQAEELLERMTRLFRTRSAQEWEDTISAAGAPAVICRTSAEWLQHPHARAAGMVVEVDDPTYGRMLQPGVTVRLSETTSAPRGPAPALDQHRDDILAELHTAPRRPGVPMVGSADDRPALAGCRMLDLAIVLAGPACGRALMEYGADVVKVDDPHDEGPRPTVSRGKRSILLDLRHDDGRDVLRALVERSDVFLENFRKGVVGKLGFDYETVRELRPDIVYVSMNTYGPSGPFSDRPGYEHQAEAATGMQERFGGGPPAMQSFLVNDYGTGILGAFAAGLGLYHRNRTGRGQRVDCALAATAMLLQSPFMNLYDGKVWDEPRGQHVLGTGHLHRMYRAADGWLFVAAPGAKPEDLDAVEGLEGAGKVEPHRLGAVLEERFPAATVATWVSRLAGAGIAAHQVRTVPDAMSDPLVFEHGLRLVRDHPDGGQVDTIGPMAHLSRTPALPGRPLRSSRDAPEILTEIGRADDLPRLLEQGTVVIRERRRKS